MFDSVGLYQGLFKIFSFLRDVKKKLCSKFGEDRSKAGLTILAVVAGWTDTGRMDGGMDGQAKVNLYSVQCYALHWTDNKIVSWSLMYDISTYVAVK